MAHFLESRKFSGFKSLWQILRGNGLSDWLADHSTKAQARDKPYRNSTLEVLGDLVVHNDLKISEGSSIRWNKPSGFLVASSAKRHVHVDVGHGTPV